MFKIFKKGFNYSQDGRGNRLVYHLFGCNLACPWCSNPEGLFYVDKKSYVEVSVDELVNEVISSKPLFFDGGGVTFTGGEPTLQFDDLKDALIKLKSVGINTCIENNGTSSRLFELFPFVDELIMDFKHYDNKVHTEIIGLDSSIIKKNIDLALEKHPDLLIRTVLISGFNTSDDDLKGFIDFFKGKNTQNARFEFLPYHEYGKVKWTK